MKAAAALFIAGVFSGGAWFGVFCTSRAGAIDPRPDMVLTPDWVVWALFAVTSVLFAAAAGKVEI